MKTRLCVPELLILHMGRKGWIILVQTNSTMRKACTPLIVLLSAGTVAAQCTSSIPANAIVVTSNTAAVHSESGSNFWLCNEAFQQVFTGSNNHFWIEPNAFFNSVNGNNNTIYYKGAVALGSSDRTMSSTPRQPLRSPTRAQAIPSTPAVPTMWCSTMAMPR